MEWIFIDFSLLWSYVISVENRLKYVHYLYNSEGRFEDKVIMLDYIDYS